MKRIRVSNETLLEQHAVAEGPRFMARAMRPRQSPYRSAGNLWGDPLDPSREWHGYLKVTPDHVFDIKADFVESGLESFLRINVLNPSWDMMDMNENLMSLRGRKTMRGFIKYPDFLQQAIDPLGDTTGEMYSFTWQHGARQIVGRRPIAWRITAGSTREDWRGDVRA